MTWIVDGRALGEIFRQRIADVLRAAYMRGECSTPTVVIFQVGNNHASHVYVRRKSEAAEHMGMKAMIQHFPENVPEEALLREIVRVAEEPTVHGMMVQLPLPPHLNTSMLLNAIPKNKDVDGLTSASLGALLTASGDQVLPSFCPCTPLGCLALLKWMSLELGRPLKGLRAVVVGRSTLVGRPLAELLLKIDCTVTIAHSRTADLGGVTRDADIVVTAVGVPGLLRGTMVRQGVFLVDVGGSLNTMGVTEGDIALQEMRGVAAAATPVPGGVGPMTVTCLLYNVLKAAFMAARMPLERLEPIGLEPIRRF